MTSASEDHQTDWIALVAPASLDDDAEAFAEQILSTNCDVIVDMGDVTLLTASGARSLADAIRPAREAGRAVVARNCSDLTRVVMSIACLDEVMPVLHDDGPERL